MVRQAAARHPLATVPDREAVRAVEHEAIPTAQDDMNRPLIWQRRPEFGPFLRGLRVSAGMSLRQASAAVGLSFTLLQKMEAGTRYRAPSLQLLRNLSHVYHQPMSAILETAGMTPPAPQLEDGPEAFEAVVCHPRLWVEGMDKSWIGLFGPVQRWQWLEFAYRLEQRVRTQGRCVAELLKAQGETHNPAADRLKSRRKGSRAVPFEGVALPSLQFFWRPRPDFGTTLRAHRRHRGLCLHDAAAALGLSYSIVQRWETGALLRPTIPLLWKLAEVYGIGLEALLHEAGITWRSVPFGPEGQDPAFVALILHPDLRPPGLTPQCMQAWSILQQRQLVEFAHRLEDHVVAGGESCRTIADDLSANRGQVTRM